MIHVLPGRVVRVGGHGFAKVPAVHALNDRHHAIVIEAEALGCLGGGSRHGTSPLLAASWKEPRSYVGFRFSMKESYHRYFLSRASASVMAGPFSAPAPCDPPGPCQYRNREFSYASPGHSRGDKTLNLKTTPLFYADRQPPNL